MPDAAPQPVPGAAAAAVAPAQQQLTLTCLRTILNKHMERAGDAVTPLTQISKLFDLQDAPVSGLLLWVPDYLQDLQQRVNSNGPDKITSHSAVCYTMRLLQLLDSPRSPEASLTAVLTAAQLQQVRAALQQGVQDLKGITDQQQQPAAAPAAAAAAGEGRQLRTPPKRKRTQAYVDPGSGRLSGRQAVRVTLRLGIRFRVSFRCYLRRQRVVW
jgi:hypothetical protein